MQGDYPSGRKPRASVMKEGGFEEEIIGEEVATTKPDPDDEVEAKRRRKRLAVMIVCCLVLLIIIIIIVILLGVLGTGDGPSGPPDAGVPQGCVTQNETKPETYEDFMCDLMTTLTTRESTYLRTYPTNSPYGMTVGWMTTTDKTDFLNLPRENVLERFVMTLFYFSTGGKDWFTKFEFLTQAHLCDWTGESTNAIRCAFSDRKVTDLGLPQNGMTGEIPTEIGYLTGLTRIYFSINQLSGTVPPQLALLTNLKKLYLDRNNFRGKLPEGINDLNLTTLYVNNNDFNGDLTDLCEQANATALEFDYHADCETGRVTCPCCTTCV
jgi:uncharacterized RDD family membrane protein YckC